MPARATSSRTKNRLRIVGGTFRSRVLAFPDVPGLRPTGDRIRETLFNWLAQSLTDKVCLDAFAGSGVLGFEAASRGAARVVMCETDRRASVNLAENRALLGASACEIVSTDVFTRVANGAERFDVVFCDPPFAAKLHNKFLAAVAPALATDALVYVEADVPLDALAATKAQYEIVRSARAGAVYYGLMRLVSAPTTR